MHKHYLIYSNGDYVLESYTLSRSLVVIPGRGVVTDKLRTADRTLSYLEMSFSLAVQ